MKFAKECAVCGVVLNRHIVAKTSDGEVKLDALERPYCLNCDAMYGKPEADPNDKKKVQFIEMNGEKIKITDRFVYHATVESNMCLELRKIELEGNDIDSIMDADLYFDVVDVVNEVKNSEEQFKLHHLMDKYKRWDRNEHYPS